MTTISTEISFPVGVRSLMPAEAKRRRELEARCIALLERRAFGEIILPIVDFVEPYVGIIDDESMRRSYRFTDREGELVAVRSDFTPMVARSIAAAAPGMELPLRLFYRGDVVRCEASRLGRNREFFQIGAEIVGDPSPAADQEIVRLAAELVRLCGAEPVVALSGPTAEELQAIVRDVETVIAPAGTPAASSYYTGVSFAVYAADRRVEVARGGRYDALYGRFGWNVPAVGMTVSIDPLEVLR